MKNSTKMLLIGGLLVLFGIFAIYSVSIYESFQITLRMVAKGSLTEPSNYYYFFKQMKNLIIGLILALVVYRIPLPWFEKNKNKIFIFAVIFQLLVFTPLGVEFNGSRGWLYFSGLGTIQPAEVFKIAFVFFLAGWLIRKKENLSDFGGFFTFLFMIGIFFLIFLKIPDLGTLLVIGPVALIMYWYVGGKFKYVLGLLVLGVTLGLTVGMQFHYIRERLEYFVNPDVDISGRGVGWQTKQALVSVGGGGVLGKGYGKGLQKFGYIPEAQSDFIFAAFSEEGGLLIDVMLLIGYFLLAYYFLQNLHEIKNLYYKYIGVGIISLILIQAIVNIGVNIKLLPLTGLTLPFISFGGTALMVNFIELVLLYKISNNK